MPKRMAKQTKAKRTQPAGLTLIRARRVDLPRLRTIQAHLQQRVFDRRVNGEDAIAAALTTYEEKHGLVTQNPAKTRTQLANTAPVG